MIEQGEVQGQIEPEISGEQGVPSGGESSGGGGGGAPSGGESAPTGEAIKEISNDNFLTNFFNRIFR